MGRIKEGEKSQKLKLELIGVVRCWHPENLRPSQHVDSSIIVEE